MKNSTWFDGKKMNEKGCHFLFHPYLKSKQKDKSSKRLLVLVYKYPNFDTQYPIDSSNGISAIINFRANGL